jgi:hypothetical protein
MSILIQLKVDKGKLLHPIFWTSSLFLVTCCGAHGEGEEGRKRDFLVHRYDTVLKIVPISLKSIQNPRTSVYGKSGNLIMSLFVKFSGKKYDNMLL